MSRWPHSISQRFRRRLTRADSNRDAKQVLTPLVLCTRAPANESDRLLMSAGDVEVREVASSRERDLFLRLPSRLYRSDPFWVPPLLSAVDKQLDPKRHPFFEHAEARLYLAWRGGRPVGRIAAIVNHLHNSYHNEKAGFWGFFETERDQQAAKALLDTAADTLRGFGMTKMSGPFNPSVNAECGLLVEGFNSPPVILMPYNPAYYPGLVEQAGLRPVKELYAYQLFEPDVSAGQASRQRVERLALAVRRRHPEITVRHLDMKRFEADVLTLGKLFDTARRDNWAFVPTTEAELRLMAREMKPVVVPELVLIAEVRGKPAGCMMALPDINLILRKLNGRLFPFGWARLLWGKRRIRAVRVFGSACLPEYRKLGVAALLFAHFIQTGLHLGYNTAELSWLAEGNVQSMRTLEAAVQPRLYKRYRIYGREL